MLDIIKNNMFRIVGTSANASLKERLANISKLKAYMRVGKSIIFPLELREYYEEPQRNFEIVENIASKLNNQKEFIENSLFWLYTITPNQEHAVDYFVHGDYQKARTYYKKDNNFGTIISLATIAFIRNNKSSGLKLLTSVITNDNYFSEYATFVNKIIGQNTVHSKQDIFKIILSKVYQNIGKKYLDKFYNDLISKENNEIYNFALEFLAKNSVDELLVIITESINDFDNKMPNSNKETLEMTADFINTVSPLLQKILKDYRDKTIEYQVICNKISKTIGMFLAEYFFERGKSSQYYYNELVNAFTIIKKVEEIACSPIEKSRCQGMARELLSVVEKSETIEQANT